MPRTFTTQDITDVDLDQIVITKTKDLEGNPQIRVRASVNVTLKDNADPLRLTTMNLNVNKTIQELNVVVSVAALRNAVLKALKDQIL